MLLKLQQDSQEGEPAAKPDTKTRKRVIVVYVEFDSENSANVFFNFSNNFKIFKVT